MDIRANHVEFKARSGSPRVHAGSADRGPGCCVNTVARLMRDHGIRAKTARKYRRTTDPNHDPPVAGNLPDRRFEAEPPNQSWVADVTCLPTREGRLYLAAVEGPCSRRVVGRSMADHPEGRPVVEALAPAVERRLPGEGLLAPSDRGSRYTSDPSPHLLARHDITCGMSRRIDCRDNAPMESFFASLQRLGAGGLPAAEPGPGAQEAGDRGLARSLLVRLWAMWRGRAPWRDGPRAAPA